MSKLHLSATNLTSLGLVLAVLLLITHMMMPGIAYSQTAPAPTASGGTFEQRLAQRKAERAITVDQKEQNRLQNTCVAAQGNIRALQRRTATAMASRATVNQRIDAKLWLTIGKLKLAQKDTFNLEKQRLTLADKNAAFQTNVQLYLQSLDDSIVINCRADVVGFKALLETARLYRFQLRNQSTDSRNYIVNEVKPAIGKFVTELQNKPANQDSGNTPVDDTSSSDSSSASDAETDAAEEE